MYCETTEEEAEVGLNNQSGKIDVSPCVKIHLIIVRLPFSDSFHILHNILVGKNNNNSETFLFTKPNFFFRLPDISAFPATNNTAPKQTHLHLIPFILCCSCNAEECIYLSEPKKPRRTYLNSVDVISCRYERFIWALKGPL